MSTADAASPATSPAASSSPRVSVIIPAYNVARYLPETLHSALAQTVPPHEILIINDGSPDTPALEAALAPFLAELSVTTPTRIVYLVQENRGLSGARNTGIRAATGDLIALLDGDDLWEPLYLERQLAHLAAHPELDVVYCNARFFGDSIYAGQDYMTVCPSVGEPTSAALLTRTCHVFVSVLARAAALKQLEFDEALRSSEDFDCWLRLTAAGFRIGYHRDVLVNYRKHRASLSADPTWMAQSNLKVLRNAAILWPPDSTEGKLLAAATARKSAELSTIRGKQALANRDIPAAVTHLQAANDFYKSSKLRAILSALRTAPGLVRALFTLRGRVLRVHRDTN